MRGRCTLAEGSISTAASIQRRPIGDATSILSCRVDRCLAGTKFCLWQVLVDFPKGLPISEMLKEVTNRGLRKFDGNKNPLGQVRCLTAPKHATPLQLLLSYPDPVTHARFGSQIASDLVRDRTNFFHFVGTNIWTITCALLQCSLFWRARGRPTLVC